MESGGIWRAGVELVQWAGVCGMGQGREDLAAVESLVILLHKEN
jgi:hypothetical protein